MMMGIDNLNAGRNRKKWWKMDGKIKRVGVGAPFMWWGERRADCKIRSVAGYVKIRLCVCSKSTTRTFEIVGGKQTDKVRTLELPVDCVLVMY